MNRKNRFTFTSLLVCKSDTIPLLLLLVPLYHREQEAERWGKKGLLLVILIYRRDMKIFN